MNTLRRYSALLATLVLTCVGAQTLDMGLCCDASAPAPLPVKAEVTVGTTSAGSLSDVAARPSASGEERGAPDQAAQPDCLCHLVFTSTSTRLVLLAVATPSSLAAEAPQRLRSALLSPPGHVPIA